MQPANLDGRRVVTAWRRLVREEEGVALILALLSMLVLTATLTAVILSTAAGARDAHRVNAGQKAYALAESGVHNALAVLYPYYSNPSNAYPGDQCLLRPQASPTTYAGYDASPAATLCGTTGNPYSNEYNGGSCTSTPSDNCVTWSGALQPVTGLPWDYQWVIRSNGTLRNPTGPSAANVMRTVTVKVPLIPGDSKLGTSNILEWIYAKTDLIFNNSVGISAPLFADGNLTLSSTAVVCGNARKLNARYDLTLENPQNQVGLITDADKCPQQPDSQMAEVHVGGNCKWKNQPAHPTCSASDNVNATLSDTNFDPAFAASLRASLPDPVVGLQNAKPGPNHPCTSFAPSGNPPPFSFNIGGNPANTPANPINLTPATSYSCKVTIDSRPIGELSWNAGTKVLTVQGNIYIDGSATVTANASYKGRALFFLTGVFVMDANGETLCAVPNGNHCDLAANHWDPNVNVLVIYALGTDGKSPPPQTAGPNGVVLKAKVEYQGGLMANNAINLDTNAIAQGPMVSVNGFVNAGQTNNISFPAIQFLPGGVAPGSTPGKLMLPRDFSGG